CAPNWDLFPYW
nr:immunoglobulin heavy chain junction region [Mus musculus]MBK4198745.1 immunoglobulin heavy chain junction region [Mus musculus]